MPGDLYKPLGKCIQCGEPTSLLYCERCLPSHKRSEDMEKRIDEREQRASITREIYCSKHQN